MAVAGAEVGNIFKMEISDVQNRTNMVRKAFQRVIELSEELQNKIQSCDQWLGESAVVFANQARGFHQTIINHSDTIFRVLDEIDMGYEIHSDVYAKQARDIQLYTGGRG